MKLAVIHPSLNVMGGAEHLAIAMLQAFQSRGHEACLVTLEKTNWKYIERLYGCKPKVSHEIVCPHLNLPVPYEPMHWKWIERLFYNALRCIRDDFELAVNTQPERLYIDANMFYIHDPHALMLGIMPKKNSRNCIWSIYRKSRRYLLNQLRNVFQTRMVLTNSNYSRGFLNKYWGIDATVVYPPVDLNLYHNSYLHAKHSKPWVVTVSRFSSSKNLETIPDVAARVPEARFFIIGSVGSGDARLLDKAVFRLMGAENSVMRKLRSRAKKLGVLDRMVLMPNASLCEKLEVMARGQVCLHTGPSEGFGMAVAEAMAAGLAPVVHKSGGPWIDILQKRQGVYGYAFETIEEAAQRISGLLQEDVSRLSLVEAAKARIQAFSKDKFESDMLRAVTGSIDRSRVSALS